MQGKLDQDSSATFILHSVLCYIYISKKTFDIALYHIYATWKGLGDYIFSMHYFLSYSQ